MGHKIETLEEALTVIEALRKQVAELQQMVNAETCKQLADNAIQHWARDSQEQKKRADSLAQELDLMKSFYNLAIKERDYERNRVDRLELELKFARGAAKA